MSWVAVAIGGSALVGAGASMYSADKMGDGGGYEGGGVVTMPQYEFTEPRLKLTSDFYSDQIQNLISGQAPPYLQQYLPKVKAGMKRELQQSYLGRPGERRGAIELAREAGAASGLGPKGQVARSEKQIRDYMDKSSAIDEYMAGLEMGMVQDAAKTFPYYSQMMPTGPNAQVTQAQQIPQRPDYTGQTIGNIMGAVPWEQIIGGSQVDPWQNIYDNFGRQTMIDTWNDTYFPGGLG